jgi:peroxiredoxin
MARTPSNMLPLMTPAPDFELKDVTRDEFTSLNQVRGDQGTVIFFICNHCPFVIHVNQELVRVASDYMDKGIGFAAISSNDVVNYPDDSPELMKKVASELHYPFPYLYDESQEVARAYDAACTPDIYLFDAELRLVYRGQLDDSRPGNEIPVTGKDLREALDRLLSGQEIPKEQKPSLGCNIKWK